METVDRVVRNAGLLDEWEKHPMPPDVLSKKPSLYVPIPKHKGIYVVQYVLPHGDSYEKKYGPLFFYVRGEVAKIDKEAELIEMFKLNGRHYLLLMHGCWVGCGDHGNTLLQIKGDRFRVVFEDSTWAD